MRTIARTGARAKARRRTEAITRTRTRARARARTRAEALKEPRVRSRAQVRARSSSRGPVWRSWPLAAAAEPQAFIVRTSGTFGRNQALCNREKLVRLDAVLWKPGEGQLPQAQCWREVIQNRKVEQDVFHGSGGCAQLTLAALPLVQLTLRTSAVMPPLLKLLMLLITITIAMRFASLMAMSVSSSGGRSGSVGSVGSGSSSSSSGGVAFAALDVVEVIVR